MAQSADGSTRSIGPLGMGEVLDLSFRTFGRNWKPLLVVGLINTLPLVLIFMLPAFSDPLGGAAGGARLALQVQRGDFSFLVPLLVGVLITGLVFLLLNPLLRGALIKACSQAVLGEPVALGPCFATALRRYFGYLGTMLLTGLAYIVAFPALVVAGLVILFFLTVPAGYLALGTYLVFSYHAVVLEGEMGGPLAWGRSMRLVSGRFWPLLGLGVAFSVLYAVASYAASFVLGLPFQLYAAFGAGGPLVALLGRVLPQLSTAVLLPFIYLGQTVAYYETRARKEGFDLVQAAEQQLDPAPQP